MYAAIIKSTDNRLQSQAATPTVLRNCFVEAAPEGAQRRSAFFIRPTPGRTRRTTLAAGTRGVFCEPGSLSSDLYVAAGAALTHVSSAWVATTIAALPSSSDVVTMRALRANMVLRDDGDLYGYDGATFAQLTDVDIPSPVSTLAVVGNRAVAAEEGGDVFGWSAAGDYSTWPASGIAADVDLADPIVGQENCNGSLCSLNSTSIQFWEATGGAEDEAFAPIPGATFRSAGLFARDLVAKTRDGLMLCGSDRVVYDIPGLSVQPVINADIEQQMKDLTDAELAAGVLWSYVDGSHEFIGFNFGLERCLVLDRSLGLWHERTRFGQSVYDVEFACAAYGKTIVGGRNTPYLYSFDHDVFTDDGDAIEREMTVYVPVQSDVPIDRIVLDAEWREQPESGQGSAPQIMLSVSLDNGHTFCDERVLDLPVLGQYGARVQDFCFGLANAECGVLVKIRITDPVGFAFHGIWLNAKTDEVP